MKIMRSEQIFGQSSSEAVLEFDPYHAIDVGKRCFPFVEIDPTEVVGQLQKSNLMGPDIFCAQDCKIGVNLPLENALGSEELPCSESISIDSFSERIRAGEYLDGYFVGKDFIIIVLGTDETWVLVEQLNSKEVEDSVGGLISLSNSNIKDFGVSDRFRKFSL